MTDQFNSYDELVFLKTEVEELKTKVENIGHFIMKMLDRIVALERERNAREAADQAGSADEEAKR
jgi:hypothetical protein